MESQQTTKVNIIPAFLPFYTEKKRFKFAFGGRGSGKSMGVSDILLLLARERQTKVLCGREIQNSISDSVHALLESRVKDLELDDYSVQKTQIHNVASLSEFIFAGLQKHTIDSLKSYFGINYFWGEEAQSISQQSLEILTPTIRADESELWFTFNRLDVLDPVYKLMLRECKESVKKKWIWPDGQTLIWTEHRGPDAIGIFINYDGNPFFPDVLRKEMEKDKEENYSLYLHKWLGMPQPEGGDTLIGPELVIESVNRTVEQWEKVSLGVDPARYGDDESVVCERKGFKILPFKTFKGINTMQLSGIIINMAKEIYKTHKEKVNVKVDDTGIGSGVTDRLEELAEHERVKGADNRVFFINVVPIINNGKVTDNDYYDYGAQMWGEMKKALKTIKIPDDEELINQLTSRKYKIWSDGRIRLERKEDMKKRGLHSPDRADALALCLADSKIMDFSTLGSMEMGKKK